MFMPRTSPMFMTVFLRGVVGIRDTMLKYTTFICTGDQVTSQLHIFRPTRRFPLRGAIQVRDPPR